MNEAILLLLLLHYCNGFLLETKDVVIEGWLISNLTPKGFCTRTAWPAVIVLLLDTHPGLAIILHNSLDYQNNKKKGKNK